MRERTQGKNTKERRTKRKNEIGLRKKETKNKEKRKPQESTRRNCTQGKTTKERRTDRTKYIRLRKKERNQ